VVAAATAIVTALLLQATVIGPWAAPVPVSLPAVLVAAIALVDGPGAGIGFGFAAGLIADLTSNHAAGVLALCWLGVGLVAGFVADRGSNRRDAATVAVVSALGALASAALCSVIQADGASVSGTFVHVLPALVGDSLLALGVVPLVRRFLRSDSLRAPRPSSPRLLAEVRRD
jgi:cell shape-determining protein MreD